MIVKKDYEEKLDEKYLLSMKEERKLLNENNNEENENNHDLLLNNQITLLRTFNSNYRSFFRAPTLRRRNMNENNQGLRRRNNNENNYNN